MVTKDRIECLRRLADENLLTWREAFDVLSAEINKEQYSEHIRILQERGYFDSCDED